MADQNQKSDGDQKRARDNASETGRGNDFQNSDRDHHTKPSDVDPENNMEDLNTDDGSNRGSASGQSKRGEV